MSGKNKKKYSGGICYSLDFHEKILGPYTISFTVGLAGTGGFIFTKIKYFFTNKGTTTMFLYLVDNPNSTRKKYLYMGRVGWPCGICMRIAWVPYHWFVLVLTVSGTGKEEMARSRPPVGSGHHVHVNVNLVIIISVLSMRINKYKVKIKIKIKIRSTPPPPPPPFQFIRNNMVRFNALFNLISTSITSTSQPNPIQLRYKPDGKSQRSVPEYPEDFILFCERKTRKSAKLGWSMLCCICYAMGGGGYYLCWIKGTELTWYENG